MAHVAAAETEHWTTADMEGRVVRYADLRPCTNAFIDTRTPGSAEKENFTIIGPGVSENPDQHVHIPEPHGFNIGGARQPPGCVNSQHSHDTAEIFVVHSGRWQINIGEHGKDAHLIIEPGDVAAVPTGLFRGFTNIGDDTGFLWVVLGEDDPGRVLWAPYVFDMAKEHGLVLLDNGSLIDTAAGQTVPDGATPMPRTSAAQVAAMHRPTHAELEAIVWRDNGAAETGSRQIIGPEAAIAGTNGIVMHRIDITVGDILPMAAPAAPRVLFVHRGQVDLAWDGGVLTLDEGDTITVPLGLAHRLLLSHGAALYHVGA
jgi:mannose-6-phosphate isomerase-like protein (cupin superfamily)